MSRVAQPVSVQVPLARHRYAKSLLGARRVCAREECIHLRGCARRCVERGESPTAMTALKELDSAAASATAQVVNSSAAGIESSGASGRR